MAEDKKDSPLKRSFSPGLEDNITAIEAKAARTTGPSDDLNDFQKRWVTVGICLHAVISPLLREYIIPVLIKLYYRLTISNQIDRQKYPSYLKTYSSKKLNYETLNKNKENFGKMMNKYDYRVQNPVDLSKLFLLTNMTHYKDINDSCDSSAVLGLIVNILDFPLAVRTNAEKVRSNIRNSWAHCIFSEWDTGKFSTSFREMERLINSLTMKVSKKKNSLDELMKLETHGPRSFGATLNLELFKEIRQENSVIAKYVKILKFNLENEIQNKAADDKVIQNDLRILKEKVKDITQHQEEIVPKHIRDDHENEIRDWEKENQTFIETRATEHVMTWLSKCNIAVITGSSGTGKSYLIHHVALALRHIKKYDIIPLSFVTAPLDIMNYYNKSRNQVFVIDDICGKGTINVEMVNTWKDLMEKIKDRFISNSSNTEETMVAKLLISCRLHVFNDPQFRGLTLFTEHAFNLLSETLCLLPEERILMIKKYLKTNNIDHVINILCNFDFFPLLCKMSVNISYKKLPIFLTSPIDSINQHIEQIINSQNKHQLCALTLSILFEEGFKEEWLKCRLKADSLELRQKLNEITRHCDIDLDSGFARQSLKDGFSTLLGTFLKKNGTKYSIIHDRIRDIVSIVCGQYLDECFIRYADGRFIGDKYIFRSIEANSTKDFIALSEEMEEEYFERIVDDLRQRDIYSTLHNKQLIHESYRKKLIRYLDNNVKDVQDLFNKIDKYDIELQTDKGQVRNDYTNDDDTERKVKFPLIEAATEGYADIVEFLIKMGCNVNKTDSFSISALYKACEGGHQDVIEILLKYSADASLCDNIDISPLYMACKVGNTNIVKMLLANNADVCKHSKLLVSPLRVACEQGNVKTVKLLLEKKADVNLCDILVKHCPLHVACKAGHLDVVKLLLKKNADVNRNSMSGGTPLNLACLKGYADIVRELLENKAEVNGTPQCKSPIYLACKAGNVGIVKMILAWHTFTYPEKHQRDDKIYSPLAVACKMNRIEIIQLLQQKCSDRITYFDKYFSLEKAAFYGCTHYVKMYMNTNNLREKPDFSINEAMYLACKGGNHETVQYFSTQGIDIFQCNIDDRSLLHAACEAVHEKEDHKYVINFLIENQLDISKPDKKGLSPLHLACKNDLINTCKLLIQNKADLNMQDSEDRSPLHFACQRENFDTVELLLENKANIKLCDNAGKTPLHVICERFSKYTHYFGSFINQSSLMVRIEMSMRCKSIAKSLIARNADVNSSDSEGDTPLHTSCINGDYELVNLLLFSKKSNINLQNLKGQTALYLACRSGFENIVTLLLDHNADTYKEDKEGKSPTCILLERRRSIVQFRNFFKSINNDNIANFFESTFESNNHILRLFVAYQIKNKCMRSKETDQMQISINTLSK